MVWFIASLHFLVGPAPPQPPGPRVSNQIDWGTSLARGGEGGQGKHFSGGRGCSKYVKNLQEWRGCEMHQAATKIAHQTKKRRSLSRVQQCKRQTGKGNKKTLIFKYPPTIHKIGRPLEENDGFWKRANKLTQCTQLSFCLLLISFLKACVCKS